MWILGCVGVGLLVVLVCGGLLYLFGMEWLWDFLFELFNGRPAPP